MRPDPTDGFGGVRCAWSERRNGGQGTIFNGHTQRANYLSTDDHVKAMQPFDTVDSTGGGSNSVNEWFRDAKFGIWAHWGPQFQPGQGDWYARSMNQQGNPDYEFQCAHYGNL